MLAVARRIPVGEVLPAFGLLAIAAMAVGARPLLIGLVWLAWVTPRLVAVDLAEHRLPDAIVLPGYPIVLAALALDGAAGGADLGRALLGAAGCGLVFLLLHLVGGMGFGDVKLAPLLGALAAAVLPGGALVWVVVVFLLGGVGAAVVLVRRGLGARMPFGPAMLAGAWVVVVLT